MSGGDTRVDRLTDMLAARSSVREFDATRSIGPDEERRIAAAAQKAPTTSNLQAYSFISVKDRGLRARIAELAGRQEFIRDASLFWVACADLARLDAVTRKAGRSFHQGRYFESTLVACVDAALAGTAAALVAESLGFGTCMIGAVRNHPEDVAEALGLPAHVFPVFGICIGHAVKRNPPKQRLATSGVLFVDRYDTAAMEAEITAYDEVMAASGVYEHRHFPIEGGEAEARIPYGWIEHTARRVATTDPAKVRAELRRVMESRGFSFR